MIDTADVMPFVSIKYLPESADNRLRRAGNDADGGRELCRGLVSGLLVTRPELIKDHLH